MLALADSLTQDLAAVQFEYRMMEQERERLEAIDRNWKYYHGFHSAMLPTRAGQVNDNVTINLARLIVDKSASFLFGKEVTFELDHTDTTPEEEWLEAVWRRNRKMTFLMRLAVTGGVTGHVFIKIVPDTQQGRPPRLVSIEPEYVTVSHAGEDIEDVWRYRIQWIERDRENRAMSRRQDIERDPGKARWQVINRIAYGSRRWEPDPEHPDTVWEYPWPPMIDCQNLVNPGAYWGLSDLEDLRQQDAINYIASKVQRILRYHAHPKTIGKAFDPDQVKVGEDEMLVLPGENSDLFNLEMQSDLGSSLAFMDKLIQWFLATARTPRLDPAVVSVGALSGFALKVLYGDALEKAEVKRRTYGDMLVELNRRLCDLGGFGTEHYTEVYWQSPLPEDEREEQTRDQFELDYGLASKETVQARRNIDHEVEEQRMSEQEAAEGNVGAMLLRQFETGRAAE